MYIIQKCVSKDINALCSKDENIWWERAWWNGKAEVSTACIDDAIREFYEKTSRVRCAPYRLASHNGGTVLASINTRDAYLFKKHTIFAVGFKAGEQNINDEIDTSPGVVAPLTMGLVAGASNNINATVRDVVNNVAYKLQSLVSTHKITTRFNSHGDSGGAYLVTSPVNGLLANTDIGISYNNGERGKLRLLVANKYLSDPSKGNSLCRWTGLLDFEGFYDDVEMALGALYEVVRKATNEEIDLLLA